MASTATTCGLHALELKRHVRDMFVDVAVATEKTMQAKESADRLQLQLQNLLYQKKHLLQEIQKCAAFQSRHEALGMVDEVEFQAAGPPDADALAGDPHKLMLARIDWELQQRCRLEEQFEQLKAERVERAKLNEGKSENVDSLPAHLAALFEAAKPLEKVLGCTATPLEMDTASTHLLPPPLYILHVHAVAYSEAYGQGVTVSIDGDVQAAADFSAADLAASVLDDEVKTSADDDNDDDNNDDDEDKRALVKKSRKSNASKSTSSTLLADNSDDVDNHDTAMDTSADVVERASDESPGETEPPTLTTTAGAAARDASQHATAASAAVAGLSAAESRAAARCAAALTPFPLKVVVTLPCPSSGASVAVTFAFFPALQIVTVQHVVSGAAGQDISDELGVDLLAHLFAGDAGLAIPNPLSLFRTDALALKPFAEYVAEIGRPFRWAQVLSGLMGPQSAQVQAPGASATDTEAASRLQRQSMVHVLKAICARVDSRITLGTQLAGFATGKIKVPAAASELFPLKGTAKLVSFQEMSKTGPESSKSTFQATFVRDAMSLVADIEIEAAFPAVIPYFHLSFVSESSGRSTGDNNLKAMENEVNVFAGREFAAFDDTYILSLQLRRLQMCFDIYMEVEDDMAGAAAKSASGFGRLFIQGIRGRDRLRPFCFDASKGFFVHRSEL